MMSQKLQIVLILTFGFGGASLLGYLAHRFKLSPILGYLLAGYLIGPFSPGYVADLTIAEQLAEIGVILMMLGVGLHLKWRDLSNVKHIAIPGAIGQTLGATLIGILLIYTIGWPIETGIIVGMAIGVASTVVLIRMLTDNHLLHTPEGHIAIGWLIVEDILTVFALLLLPTMASTIHGSSISLIEISYSTAFVIAKFILLIAIVLTVGNRIVTTILTSVARTRSQDLLTLTVLALTFLIATGSAFIFGTSIALGAFIAGMVIGQTNIRHQAIANALPVKDAFAVIFFLSVGMLFNPAAIADNFYLFMGILLIILIAKPLIAIAIVKALDHPFKTALVLAVSLAQIGEFSFILAEEALKLDILPDAGYDMIVAAALASITLNPLLFKLMFRMERMIGRKTKSNHYIDSSFQKTTKEKKAVVIGFGPVGEKAVETLEKLGYTTMIIDYNVDTVTRLHSEKRLAIYGDASHPKILESVDISRIQLMIITVPEVTISLNIIETARHQNPSIHILARNRFLKDEPLLKQAGVEYLWCEEEAAMHAFEKALEKFVT